MVCFKSLREPDGEIYHIRQWKSIRMFQHQKNVSDASHKAVSGRLSRLKQKGRGFLKSLCVQSSDLQGPLGNDSPRLYRWETAVTWSCCTSWCMKYSIVYISVTIVCDKSSHSLHFAPALRLFSFVFMLSAHSHFRWVIWHAASTWHGPLPACFPYSSIFVHVVLLVCTTHLY